MFLLGSFVQVSAYSTPCERFGNADAVFVGKYVEVNNGQASLIDSKLYFEVEESFYGIDKKTRVLINVGDSLNWQNYKIGDSYLIYAINLNNILYAPWGNSPVANVPEDLQFLRNLTAAKGLGMKVFGDIDEDASAVESEELKRKIISNIKIRFRKIDVTDAVLETFTDFDGKYEITLPVGKYRVETIFPSLINKNLSISSVNNENITAKDGGCFEKSFWVRNNVSVSGRLLYSNGQPIEDAFVSIVAEEGEINASEEETEKTDKSGRFKFERIPIGRYHLVLNYLIDEDDDDLIFPQFFYPNTEEKSKAQLIEIKLGQSPKPFEFRLPTRFTTKKVYGTVFWEDGTPADFALAYLKDTNKNSQFKGSTSDTDDDGKFILTGFVKGKFFVKARDVKKIGDEMIEFCSQSEEFDIAQKLPNFKLILKQGECSE